VRRRPLLAAALLALAVAATGCAIPTQGAPSTIANSKVPFNLMDPHPPTTTTTLPSSFVPVKVYFLNSSDQLVLAQRFVAPPAPLIAIIRALLEGPTSGETTANITTAIPSNVNVLGVSTQPGNPVTVNLSSAFGEITGTNTELAVGQIVATVANEVGLTTGVVFEIDGQRISVPIANGSLVSGPVYLIEFLGVPPA
jgi:sporulation and spore germination protein